VKCDGRYSYYNDRGGYYDRDGRYHGYSAAYGTNNGYYDSYGQWHYNNGYNGYNGYNTPY
jgi:hypothetical protein